jgi:hypothetical protein
VVQPETVLRWHRTGFKMVWRWKSRHRAGRPRIDRGLRDLIRRMSRENPLWGASRIHGELLMLGFEVAQSTVSKYMARPSKPPSQTWKTFMRNHAEAIAAILAVWQRFRTSRISCPLMRQIFLGTVQCLSAQSPNKVSNFRQVMAQHDSHFTFGH